jgi:hypothetical protein
MNMTVDNEKIDTFYNDKISITTLLKIFKKKIPYQFYCPITLKIMQDPVICEDGITYERTSILSLGENINPITLLPINTNIIIENRAIKHLIEEFNEYTQKKVKKYLIEEYTQKEVKEVVKYKQSELFCCPITLEIMKNPVICEDGFTYEKSAFLSLKQSISPLTRLPININKIIENTAIKQLITVFKKYKQAQELKLQKIQIQAQELQSQIFKDQELKLQKLQVQIQELQLQLQNKEYVINQNLIKQKVNFDTNNIGKQIMIHGLCSISGQKYNNKFGIIISTHTYAYRVKLIENINEPNSDSILLKLDNIQFIEL